MNGLVRGKYGRYRIDSMRRPFYGKGKCKLDYIRKEKFHVSKERNVSNLKTLKNVIW